MLGRHLRLVHRNARRLLKLVNSLLDFARVEAGRVQAKFESVDLAAVTEDLASTFRSAIERAGLRFEVDCELDEPVYVDLEMWEQIVLNLLSNALKFTFNGRIGMRLRAAGGNAVLEVADTGVGIPAGELPRLFERFHRIEGSQGRSHEGSGIGLALVQELAKLHGGTVAVDSVPGQGTTFRVALPVGNAHLPREALVESRVRPWSVARIDSFREEALEWAQAIDTAPLQDEPVAAALTPAGPAREITRRALVLLADDNADMREYVRRLLESEHEVVTVADGEAALQTARDRRPDLILTDVMMPKLDGFGLLRALRAEPDMSTIPIILLSARAGPDATVEGLDAGADDYLLKPFSARELLARVSGALSLSRLRRESAAQLRVSEERFRAVQETSIDGFTVLEAVRNERAEVCDFKWSYVNATAARMSGREREWLLGKRLLEVHPGNRDKGLFDRYLQVLQTGTPWAGEILYTADGIHLYVRVAVARVGDGVAISAVDLSARWRAEEALKDADRQKDEFLAMLAHELRNPLAPIGNAVELLSRTLPSEGAAQSALRMARRQVLQLTRLVDDLLDVSRITQGRIELKRQPLEIANVIAQAVEAVDPLLRDKDHRISITSSGTQALRVNADPARLMQCIVNVLSNAAKYTDPGGEIRISSRLQGSHVVIEVADNGMGMAPELLPRIFDLFVQGDRALDRSQGGLGVGLAVVRRLVEMHEGSVAARSAGPGKGSIFQITLPSVGAASVGVSAAAPDQVIARRVLIVDDNRDSADSLALLLEIEGHEIATAYTAHEALERAQSLKPQVILLDIGLPEINGYEIARRLRQMRDLDGVCLIALSGYGQAEDRHRAHSAGFDDHLIKPADLAKLRSAIARHPAARALAPDLSDRLLERR